MSLGDPTPAVDLAALVDVTNGVIDRRVFGEEEIFRMELKNLFARAWLFVGHESQIPEPGDFFSSRMHRRCLDDQRLGG